MSPKAFSLTARVVFILIALGHVLRLAMRAWSIVQGISIPVRASGIAVVLTAYRAYQGFRLARKFPSRDVTSFENRPREIEVKHAY